ncbi:MULTISPECIES: ATP-dependent RNA helicase DbpA [Vibrio]|uniref:ATP-dependent RNA helicase DbpA n=1 Tax=Vibrio TaxID=662 RepID=UPI0001B93BF4|nr:MULTISPECIES: ATP-dependent RNA helicase DbpA [Vibrio]MCM5509110.1 ATP-dependent RNA helicase DbpA [Vibrio sp. SCSIO 43169]EEX31856.1 ATP-dependent RNA helicase DbpA [Vibrio coralliilyticus ATCC BAA-450]MDE3896961.1 ATP-dependent RNA helicase DbpA [Vibrio sp. CC007]QFT38206.1 ATP-dependent RNA helicase DbpA [Vibrio sp. THAF64]QGM37256.1 ATP-dependent RNA helicase DbpA [Vibrio sp. THAF191d]
MTTSFKSLNLRSELIETLNSLNYTEMTPIQQQALPIVLEGKDVIGQGKTGSGKTAAFTLGLLSNLSVKRFRVQTLVLCPTRELADQVAKEVRTLARGIHNIKVLTLCGGMPMGPQIGSLEHGAHILVGTPGRILDHLSKGRINLAEMNTLVLDEADRMLEMGFEEAIDAIIDEAPQDRQTLLFSATFPKNIESLASKVMRDPQMIKVESTHQTTTIEQRFYKLNATEERDDALEALLLTHKPESSVVFCNTKKEVQKVTDELSHRGFSVVEIHGDMEQREREQALTMFANKSVSILVATDVAARGLDVDNLDAVFNFELSRDPEVHVHRIGRTGRAGSKGVAFSFYSEKEEYRVARIDEYMDIAISPAVLPEKPVERPFYPKMQTIQILGGKKQKVRAGDILGALTKQAGLDGKKIGKINILPMVSYVAVEHEIVKPALKQLQNGKMKGRNFKARVMK